MAKKWIETVKPWSEIARTRAYPVRVIDIHRIANPKRLSVTLEFLSSPHDGRQLEIPLPLPIHETGITAAFFTACGCDIAPNAQISPRAVVNAVLSVRLTRGQSTDEYTATSFRPLKEDHSHDITEDQP